ncbi:hypothetical protein, partial [Devosia alba]|uniref:hypothetical protein n=1 Tax=Devosia alba TaxID=3152360 RepID=UPI003D364E8B
ESDAAAGEGAGEGGERLRFLSIARPDALTPTLSHREREKTIKKTRRGGFFYVTADYSAAASAFSERSTSSM